MFQIGSTVQVDMGHGPEWVEVLSVTDNGLVKVKGEGFSSWVNQSDLIEDDVVHVDVYPAGTIGVGVGTLMPGIPDRGEPEQVFKSVVWFPVSETEQAKEFAAEYDMHFREGIAL